MWSRRVQPRHLVLRTLHRPPLVRRTLSSVRTANAAIMTYRTAGSSSRTSRVDPTPTPLLHLAVRPPLIEVVVLPSPVVLLGPLPRRERPRWSSWTLAMTSRTTTSSSRDLPRCLRRGCHLFNRLECGFWVLTHHDPILAFPEECSADLEVDSPC